MRLKPIRGPVVSTLGCVALAAVTTGCASTGARPRPFPMPGSPAVTVSAVSPRPGRTSFAGNALAGTALALRGVPYRNGGSDPNGFDCSGFTQYVFAQHGAWLPREVRDQFRLGTSVKADDIAAGDLLFFTTTVPGASHVGLAIGGSQFVHAPNSTGVVRVESVTASYWWRRFIGARRLHAARQP